MAFFPARMNSGVLQGYSPLTGDYYNCTGDGTINNPWRPDSFETFIYIMSNARSDISQYVTFADEIVSWEQELVKSGDSAEVIAQKKKTIDMNRVDPTGEEYRAYRNTARWITIPGNINNPSIFEGNDCIIKNLYVGATYTDCFLEITGWKMNGLNIINCYINANARYGIFLYNVLYLINCKCSFIINGNDTPIATRNNNGMQIYGCSLNIRYVQTPKTFITLLNNCSYGFENNNIKFVTPISTSVGEFNFSYNVKPINCKFDITTVNYNQQGSGWGGYFQLFLIRNANFKNCVFKFTNIINQSVGEYNFPVKYIVNSSSSEGQTLYTYKYINNSSNPRTDFYDYSYPSDMTACTEANLVDRDWLIAHNFPIMWEDNG